MEIRKPIKETKPYVESLNDKFNYDFQYFDVEKQNNYLEKYPELLNFLPWNCVQRRNVGMLFAYENNSDVIITIDDDNFIEREGYLDGHQNVGSTISLPVLETSSSWLNICDFLIDKNSREFFARGYPISERQISRAKKMNPLKKGRCQWWTLARRSDIDDAITRLTNPIDVTGYTRDDNFALKKIHGAI